MTAVPPRIAIAQIAMHWTTADNLAAIRRAMHIARAAGATVCAFSELALTGIHRQIVREAVPAIVNPALDAVRALARELRLAVSVGAPTFGDGDRRFITQFLIDDQGETVAAVGKRGLTQPEATFFAPATERPVGVLAGLRCSAVICREVGDHDQLLQDLPPGSTDLLFLPGALRPDPAQPTEPPGYMHDAMQIARSHGCWLVQTNWPNGLNRPEESVDGGRSIVVSPAGERLIELPRQAAGLGVFTLGERRFDWLPES